MIHFKSGLTQPAESVEENDEYYKVRIYKRYALVKKEHVLKVVPPSA